ncbi:ATP-dependent helicase fft2 [Cyphellophora attinorum]|uniref:DNA helicase n=1 Tax=Cyphellophora attinorum TaxID=1664694 RepID=A0A0N0NRJ1_9EURO|nr:ATP-dependent helicase fft2 [Phialophora attinorum]KPI44909.1 ATP-dependent helicase fft2 [Phialophora attinorum]
MTAFSGTAARLEASSDPINDSDEELFGSSYRHETVATVPLPKALPDNASESSEDEHATIATVPLNNDPATTQQSLATTQPTQLLPQAHSSSPARPPHVQVIASSPFTSPSARPSQFGRGIQRRNLMAPAGTAFRKPVIAQRGGSSDEEDLRVASAANVKTTNFKKTTVVEESPPKTGHSPFAELLKRYEHSTSNGVKRPADEMSYAYGNATNKRPRQNQPSRAMPVQAASDREPSPEFELDDIENANHRQHVRKMLDYISDTSVKDCYDALKKCHFDYDAAITRVLDMQEERNRKPIQISDDELNETPAVQKKKKKEIVKTKQQAKVPSKSITEKWSSTQQPKHLDAFSPPKELKARKRLVRGRKDRSSPDLADIKEDEASGISRAIVLDDSADDDNASDDDEVVHERNLTMDEKVLNFFSTCSAADLADTAGIKPALAQHFVSQQPFRSLGSVAKVDDPTRAPSKAKRTPVGEKIVEKVETMLQAYDAVDFLVQKCEKLAEPLKATMREWGTDVNTTGELEMIAMPDSPRSAHDSGIGTPEESSEAKPRQKKPKDYLEQPAIMSDKYHLNNYQIVGLNWLNLLYQRGLSCMLADDMGLGKTYQVIAFLSHLFEIGEKGPHLVVVPAATLENWLMEFKKFSPKLKVEPYYTTQPGAREELRYNLEQNREEVNVIVTTYNLAKAKDDAPWLRNYGFDCTIFDEGHQLKNASSQVTKKLARINGNFRLLLTGTPLQNNLKELMSLLAFMMPDLFYQKSEELTAIFEHTVKTMDDNHDALLSARRIARARSILAPFILRRKKSQVARDLPVKTSKVEWCDLTTEQSELYKIWQDKALDIRARRERGDKDVSNETTHILMKLRQASIHPWLFRRVYKDAILPKIAKQCIKAEQWLSLSPV